MLAEPATVLARAFRAVKHKIVKQGNLAFSEAPGSFPGFRPLRNSSTGGLGAMVNVEPRRASRQVHREKIGLDRRAPSLLRTDTESIGRRFKRSRGFTEPTTQTMYRRSYSGTLQVTNSAANGVRRVLPARRRAPGQGAFHRAHFFFGAPPPRRGGHFFSPSAWSGSASASFGFL